MNTHVSERRPKTSILSEIRALEARREFYRANIKPISHHCEERIAYIDSRIKALLERLALMEVPGESQDA